MLEGSSLTGVGARVEASLLGRNAAVSRKEGGAASYRLLIGDESDIEVI